MIDGLVFIICVRMKALKITPNQVQLSFWCGHKNTSTPLRVG